MLTPSLNNGAWTRRGFLCKLSNCPFPSVLGQQIHLPRKTCELYRSLSFSLSLFSSSSQRETSFEHPAIQVFLYRPRALLPRCLRVTALPLDIFIVRRLSLWRNNISFSTVDTVAELIATVSVHQQIIAVLLSIDLFTQRRDVILRVYNKITGNGV